MESASATHTAEGSWQLVSQWLAQHLPWLVVLALVTAAVCLFVRFWDRLLAWEAGSAWPVPAALAPPCIAIVRGWDPKGPFGPIGPMVTVALLAFVAALQIYGQARAERYKKLADARIRRISAGVNSIGSAVNSIGSDLSRLTAYLASEGETETDENV